MQRVLGAVYSAGEMLMAAALAALVVMAIRLVYQSV